MTSKPAQCRHIWFTGQVQGVGFRFNSQQIARRHDVCGFVRNLPDGRVEMLLEGQESEVAACFDEVMQRMGPYIQHVREEHRPATGSFLGFEIRY